MGPTVLPNEGSTVGIKVGLALLPPIIEEDDTVRIGLVGSDGDALGGGSALGELKGGEGGSLEPVGDGSDMLHSNGFNRHGMGLPFYPHTPVSIFMTERITSPTDAERRALLQAVEEWIDSIRCR